MYRNSQAVMKPRDTSRDYWCARVISVE